MRRSLSPRRGRRRRPHRTGAPPAGLLHRDQRLRPVAARSPRAVDSRSTRRAHHTTPRPRRNRWRARTSTACFGDRTLSHAALPPDLSSHSPTFSRRALSNDVARLGNPSRAGNIFYRLKFIGLAGTFSDTPKPPAKSLAATLAERGSVGWTRPALGRSRPGRRAPALEDAGGYVAPRIAGQNRGKSRRLELTVSAIRGSSIRSWARSWRGRALVCEHAAARSGKTHPRLERELISPTRRRAQRRVARRARKAPTSCNRPVTEARARQS